MFTWLVKSSADPTKLSLTLKAAAPFILTVVAWFKLDIIAGDLDKFLEAVGMIITGAFVAYGFLRKVILTITGKNGAVKPPQ